MKPREERSLLAIANARWVIACILFGGALLALGMHFRALSAPTEEPGRCGGALICGNSYLTKVERTNIEVERLLGKPADAIIGERLFKTNCAGCHKMDKDMTGPALATAILHFPEPRIAKLKVFINNEDSLIRAQDPYVLQLRKAWNQEGSDFRHANRLTEAELNDLLVYIVRL